MDLSRTVSEINDDCRRKSPIFLTTTPRVFIAPLKGFSLELGIGEKTRMMALPDGRQRF